MNICLYTGLAAILTVAVVSCTPYKESSTKKKATKKTEQTTPTPEEVKKAADKKAADQKAAAAKKKAEAEKAVTETTNTGNDTSTGGNEVKPPAEKRGDYAFANKVPGKEGFVFSPYNNKVVDVRDIPSGTLVQDPTYPAADKKFFRVP